MTARFACLALLAAVGALTTPSPVARLVLAHTAFAFGMMAWAYAVTHPALLGKSRDGRLSRPRTLLLAPYHAFTRFTLSLARARFRPAYHEIEPGLILGRHLRPHEVLPHVTHVLDMTAELPAIATTARYRVIPLLDMTGPTVPQLKEAMAFLEEAETAYVHCAIGHGRSATVVAAWLLYTNQAASAEQAIAQVKARRPRIRLNRDQQRCLRAWEAALRAAPPPASAAPPPRTGTPGPARN